MFLLTFVLPVTPCQIDSRVLSCERRYPPSDLRCGRLRVFDLSQPQHNATTKQLKVLTIARKMQSRHPARSSKGP